MIPRYTTGVRSFIVWGPLSGMQGRRAGPTVLSHHHRLCAGEITEKETPVVTWNGKGILNRKRIFTFYFHL